MSTVRHPLFARLYSTVVAPMMDRAGAGSYRQRLLEGLSGTVVEIGAGNGANFGLYPPEVDRVVAVEPEPFLRGKATEAARAAAVSVEVVDGVAERLPIFGGTADAVVCCLVLCSVADPIAALAESRRVLSAGGELRFLEHVQAPRPGGMRRVQSALDATVWPCLFGGCHCGRDTAGAITAAGFALTELDRFTFPEGSRGPAAFSILGRAVCS
ncbi:MAG: class I SAM-dependent methyltransferase [Actinomycetota bacterium]|nr:class I SAM-dependent methyltransferase [Actinomycetota bacterium]